MKSQFVQIRIDPELKRLLKKVPELNRSEVCRKALKAAVMKMQGKREPND